MKPFASRYLLLATLSLLLTACQTSSRDPAADAGPDAWQQLETNIASSELATAEDQLVKLQARLRRIRASTTRSGSWPRPICSAAR